MMRSVSFRAGILLTLTLSGLMGCHSAPRQSVPVVHARPQPAPAAVPAKEVSAGAVTGSVSSEREGAVPVPSSPVMTQPLPPRMVRKLADGGQSPAYRGLLQSAQQHQQAGQLELAASDLERALRIAPQSATGYQRLAEIRLLQKRYVSAEQLARKGLGFASGRAQQATMWKLIAQSRRASGDEAGALKADETAQGLLSP